MSDRVAIASELERLFDEQGRLLPADVVQAAADPSSPMHEHFEWNDGDAAHKFRLVQAAGLIRSFKVTITTETATGDVEDIKVRSWIAARHAGDPEATEGYLPEHKVRENPAQRELVLRQMMRDIAVLRRRYRHLSEFWSHLAVMTEEAGIEAAAS